jgi:hypothetical protein
VLELTNCDAGQYVNSAFVCAACAAGTYSSAPGSSACVACGAGLVVDATSVSCVAACPSGQYNSGGMHVCPKETVSRIPNAAFCAAWLQSKQI